MRTRIVIDSCTPQQVYNLTLAYQRTLGYAPLPTQLTMVHGQQPEPTVTVGGSAMSWSSPWLDSVTATLLLTEFDLLEQGIFDHSTYKTDRDIVQALLTLPWGQDVDINGGDLVDLCNRLLGARVNR